MARFRRRRASRAIGRMFRRSRRSSGSGMGVGSVLMGAAVAVAAKKYLSPMIPVSGMAKTAVEGGAGYFLSKKGGIMKSTGNALMILTAADLISGFIGGGSSSTGTNLKVYS